MAGAVEAGISRYKRVIGDTLGSYTDGRQATEVAIAVRILNRMLDLDVRNPCASRRKR
jgi:hypothetical protein